MWTVCNLYCHSEPSCKAIPMFTAWDNPKLAYTGILYISLLCQLSWLWTILLSGTAQSRGWQRTWSSLICTSRASKVENKSCLFGGVELVPETGRELVAFSDLTIQGLYCIYSIYSMYSIHSIHNKYSIYSIYSRYSIYSIHSIHNKYSIYSIYSRYSIYSIYIEYVYSIYIVYIYYIYSIYI